MASTKPIVVDGGAPTDATRQAPGVPVHVGAHRDPCVEEAMDDGRWPKVCRGFFGQHKRVRKTDRHLRFLWCQEEDFHLRPWGYAPSSHAH